MDVPNAIKKIFIKIKNLVYGLLICMCSMCKGYDNRLSGDPTQPTSAFTIADNTAYNYDMNKIGKRFI